MKLAYRVLVLDDDERALGGMVETLREAGYQVDGVHTYEAAKRLLASNSYDLLITDVRLRGFNGLHLVMQCRIDHPEMGVIIMSEHEEPMIEIEAGRYRARLVRKPIDPPAFLQAVNESLVPVRRQRRWPRKRVVGGFRVTADGRPAAVVDVCYGGLRLQVPGPARLPATFDVEVSGIGLHLEVEPVWMHPVDDYGAVLCGAALSSDSTPAARTWRAIVDRLSA
jgi:CheY-like chemotaxis protein